MPCPKQFQPKLSRADRSLVRYSSLELPTDIEEEEYFFFLLLLFWLLNTRASHQRLSLRNFGWNCLGQGIKMCVYIYN